MKSFILFAALCSGLMTNSAYAGPFGTEMGDKPEKFESLTPVVPGYRYITNTLPKTHTDFSKYQLSFAPSGLAFVGAFTDEKFDEKQAKKNLTEIKKQLIEKYGQPQEDKEIFVMWKDNLPNGLASIILATLKKDFKHRIELRYLYKIHKEAVEAIKKKNIDAL